MYGFFFFDFYRDSFNDIYIFFLNRSRYTASDTLCHTRYTFWICWIHIDLEMYDALDIFTMINDIYIHYLFIANSDFEEEIFTKFRCRQNDKRYIYIDVVFYVKSIFNLPFFSPFVINLHFTEIILFFCITFAFLIQ